ncbi:dihydrofolate reductase [Prosthecomicrobium sp. N25]|uniref:dihydrofolate reductase n=1 Tax=Prosthecomicrobium sp. N25 TaxID=3129254 RepID=UPI003078792A
MSDVRAMCAIGRRGQLGLDGHMPWEGETGPEYRADVERFWAATRGAVLLVGPRTMASIPAEAYAERTIIGIRSHMDPAETIARHRGRCVYIGGGGAVWRAYAPFIRHWDITRLPYDGPADLWFDPTWLTLGRT